MRVSERSRELRFGSCSSLRRSVSVTQLARRSTPVMWPAASRMTVPPASSIHCASPPDLISAAGCAQADQKPTKAICRISGVVSSQLAPPIRQRRIAVENDLARRQGGFEFLMPFFRHQRVVQVQRLQAGNRFQRRCAPLSVMPVESMLSSRMCGSVLQRLQALIVHRRVIELDHREILQAPPELLRRHRLCGSGTSRSAPGSAAA